MKTKVLIIEDSITDIELYKYFLIKGRKSKYEIQEAQNGETGLEKIRTYKPDCILLDYQLPDMNGIELVDRLIDISNLPVVMITGQGSENVAVSAIKKGVQEYLKKGFFKRHDLILSVEKAIEKVKMSQKIYTQQRDIERRANFDSLTGVYNRFAFVNRLDEIFKKNRMYLGKEKFAVIFIDLDRFKLINDSFSHIVGDKFLFEIASRIKSCVRPTDILARIGGDEFTICIPEIRDESIPVEMAERIQKALEPPFLVDGHVLHPGASIGIAIGNLSYSSSQEILRDADIAMYEAKKKGGSCAMMFNKVMQTRIKNKIEMENDLKEVIAANKLDVYYQPIVSLDRQRIEGVEALVRWWHAEKNEFVPPEDFVAIAEETSLINEIGSFVFNQSCRDIKTWRDAGNEIFLSVNLSSQELDNARLIENTKRTLLENKVSAKWVRFELTESCLVRNKPSALKTLQALVNMGLKLSLDDFGTGYSSVSYLKDFPFQSAKIDKAFLKNIPAKRSDIKLIKGMISMLHDLDLEVIVEGIENQEHLNTLMDLKSDYVQGYFLGKPMPFGEMSLVLEKSNGKFKQEVFLDAEACLSGQWQWPSVEAV